MKKMRRLLSVLLLSLLIIALLPITALAEGKQAVTTGSVNMRAQATLSASVIKTIPAGETVEVLSTQENWVKVTHGGKTGWVSGTYLKFTEAAPISTGGTIKIVTQIKVYVTAADARAKTGSTRTYAAGEYTIFRTDSNVINITREPGVPGAWINLGDNKVTAPAPVTTKPAPVATKPAPVATKPQPAPTTSQQYKILVEVPTYLSAADAQAKTNRVSKFYPGTFYIFKSYNGMLNLTKTAGEAGAWMNPAHNVLPAAPEKPVTTPAPHPDTIIAKSSVNIRASASGTAAILISAPAGAGAVMVGKDGTWAKVQYSGKTGYTAMSYWTIPSAVLAKFTEKPVPHPDTIIAKSSVNVRASASGTAAILISAPAGAGAVMVGKEGTWAKVQYSGKTGYTAMSYWTIPSAVLAKFTEKPAPHPDTIIAKSSVNVRASASGTAAILISAPAGAGAVMVGKEGTWAKVQYSGKTGYTAMSYWTIPSAVLDKYTEKPAPHPDTIVTNSSVNLRATASASGTLIANLPAGTSAVMVGRTDTWAKVQYNGKTAYAAISYWTIPSAVLAKFPDKPTPPPDPDTISAQYKVNIRTEASGTATVLANVPAGTCAVMIGRTGTWAKVQYNGKIGYTAISYWTIPSAVMARFPEKPVPNGRKVFLDPGHNGSGQGAVSNITGERVDENNINWNIALIARDMLEAKGYTVYMSKSRNEQTISTAERAALANSLGADIFISIHCNSFSNATAKGTIAFYSGKKAAPETSDWMEKSMKLSQALAQNVGRIFGSGKIVKDTSYGLPYTINLRSTMPSTLLEMGFISNLEDAIILNSSTRQKDIAKEMVSGIDDYFGFN